MKRLLLFAVVATLFVACTQDIVVDVTNPTIADNTPETLVVGFEGDDTRIQLNDAQKTVWTKGDLVSVFYRSDANQKWHYQGETGERVAELTRVEAGVAIEAMKRVVVVYPYSENYYINTETYNVQATLPAVQNYLKDSYGLDGNIMISSSEYNQFSLKSVCGWLKLQLTGDGEKVKSITLRGNNGEQVAGELYINSADATATLSSNTGSADDGETGGAGGGLVFEDTIIKEVTLDCGTGVELGAEATAFYIALPPQTFENGFTVEIEAMDGSIMTKSTDKTLTIERNHIQPMATFELPQKPIDLAMNGTANCYIISSAGNYVFPAVQGNSSIFIESISSVEILWESFGDAKTPNIGDLIKSVSYRNGYVELSTSDKYTEGNAVVAVKKDDGTILWSWHIWLTDYPDEQLYYNNTKGMMDRNLGATSDIRVDIHSLGLFYQWGRKDPFLGPGKISSVQKAASTYHWPTPEESTKETGTIEYTISHPTTFITGNRFNNDWYFTGSKSSDSSRWSYKKTIYDPCPAGWKLPSMSVWTNVWGVNTEDNGYDAYYNDAILAHWVGGDYGNILEPDNQLGEYESIWYPFTGCLNGDTGDIVSSDRWNGIWSYNSTTHHIVGFMCGRFAHTGDASYAYGVGYTYIAKDGLSVRCVKE